MLISDVQQSDLGIHIHVLFHFFFHYRLLQDSDCNSLCYPVCVCLVVSDSLQPHGLWPTRLLCPWNFPGKNTRVGCHFLLQGIFPIQGSNPRVLSLLHWQVDSLPQVPPGKPCALQQGLVVYFIYSSMYLLTLNSCFIPSPNPNLPFGNHQFAFYGSLFLFCK